MDRILKHIDENYDALISKTEVEEILNYSHRNSQRLFKRFFNETISSFQKRLKLEVAYKKLIYTSKSVGDIAYEVGYENPASLNKAFKSEYKISPSEARKNRLPIFNAFIEQGKSIKQKVDYEFIYLPPKNIYYKLIITDDYHNEPINELWDKIEEEMADVEDCCYYGLILDQPLVSKKAKCRYEACVSANPGSSSYLTKSIFGVKYIKFIHTGSYDLIVETYRQIYYSWIYFIDCEIDSSPIVECYLTSRLDVVNENEMITEIFIPVR